VALRTGEATTRVLAAERVPPHLTHLDIKEIRMSNKALCIGINDYPGTRMDLNGCVNDANDWSEVLSARGFTVKKLLDATATKASMVDAIRNLIGGAVAGDSIVITYSGHGTYAPDESGDERDGLDEALCPYDIGQGNVLLDDEINLLFAQRAAQVRILLVSDSCHSGTVTRAAPADPDAQGIRARFLPMASWLPESRLPRTAGGKLATRVSITRTHSPWSGALYVAGGDVLLAGCQEGPDNFSYDATFGGRSNGAFTYYALKALKGLKPNATYADWYGAMRQFLPSASFPQTPQLVGSKSACKLKVLA
jgi:hypothetical protein